MRAAEIIIARRAVISSQSLIETSRIAALLFKLFVFTSFCPAAQLRFPYDIPEFNNRGDTMREICKKKQFAIAREIFR